MTELQKMGAAAQKAAAVLRTAGEKKRTALTPPRLPCARVRQKFLPRTKKTLKPQKKTA